MRAGTEPTAATVWRRLAPMLAGLVLSVTLALVVAGASIVLLVVPFLLLIVWFQLVGQVVVVERRTFFAAMGRSRDLVQGSYWRVLGYAILGGADHGRRLGRRWPRRRRRPRASSACTSPPTTAIGDALAIVARVLVAPVQALLMALLYFDLRMRRDGSDIAAMLDALPGRRRGRRLTVAAGARAHRGRRRARRPAPRSAPGRPPAGPSSIRRPAAARACSGGCCGA